MTSLLLPSLLPEFWKSSRFPGSDLDVYIFQVHSAKKTWFLLGHSISKRPMWRFQVSLKESKLPSQERQRLFGGSYPTSSAVEQLTSSIRFLNSKLYPASHTSRHIDIIPEMPYHGIFGRLKRPLGFAWVAGFLTYRTELLLMNMLRGDFCAAR